MKPCRVGLVSVIIPVRNRPGLLVDAVRSALDQTYRPIEIVIVDDGSTDETYSVAASLAAAHPLEVRALRQEATGVASARNRGLAEASGEFVQFLDSDDVLMPQKFARQVAALRQLPECGISYCRTREYVLGGQWSGLPARMTGHAMPFLFPALLQGRVWAAPTPLYRRGVIEQNGPVDELAIYEDWDFEGRAAARNVRLHYCDEFLADKRDAHHLAGGRKGGTRPHKVKDFAIVHLRMLAYARAAGVTARDLDRFAMRLLAVATACAAHGLESEARATAAAAADVAIRPMRRLRCAVYRLASNSFGWTRVAVIVERVESALAVRVLKQIASWPPAFARRWRHRVTEARATVAGRVVTEWPQALAARWFARQSRQRAH